MTKDRPCADKPAAGSKVTIVIQPRGDVVASTTTSVDGTYRVAVAPGTYVVTADAGMSCEAMKTHVTAGSYFRVDIHCDTGIR